LVGPRTPEVIERLVSQAMSAAEYEGWPLADARSVERRTSRRKPARVAEEQAHHV
jgi:hypothetical protein